MIGRMPCGSPRHMVADAKAGGVFIKVVRLNRLNPRMFCIPFLFPIFSLCPAQRSACRRAVNRKGGVADSAESSGLLGVAPKRRGRFGIAATCIVMLPTCSTCRDRLTRGDIPHSAPQLLQLRYRSVSDKLFRGQAQLGLSAAPPLWAEPVFCRPT